MTIEFFLFYGDHVSNLILLQSFDEPNPFHYKV